MNEQEMLKFGSWRWDEIVNTINQQWEERLDKIVAEIQANINYNEKMNHCSIEAGLLLALDIIDHYRSEEKE